jgi:sugar phosphate isomerase/epimerase
MKEMNRRNFLAASAAASASLLAKPLPAIGVQLYTVRSIINEKPMEVLSAIEQLGFREVEVVRGNIDRIWDSLKKTQLKPVSIHIDTPLFMTKKDELPAALDDAAKRGFKYAVCPYIAPQDRGGVDVIKRLAETLNDAGKRCKAAGLTLCYHNHAFEFEPAPGGGTLLDVLMQNSDRKLVSLELDIMWSAVAGVDPISVLNKYKGRARLMHVKDLAKGAAKQYNEKVPRDVFKEAGAGSIDIPAVLRAGMKTGVRHFFVEQDQTPGAPLDSLKISYNYLKSLNL